MAGRYNTLRTGDLWKAASHSSSYMVAGAKHEATHLRLIYRNTALGFLGISLFNEIDGFRF